MKALCVHDIRLAQFTPGAVEHDATKRAIFWSCPCGCGTIGHIDLNKCGVEHGRKGLTVKCPVGIINPDGTSHWVGRLEEGQWIEK